MYLVGGYKLSSCFATCKTKEDNISTKFVIEDSSSKRLVIDLLMSNPQKLLHLSKAFFAQSLACLLTLQPPLFTFSNSLSSITRNRNFKISSMIGNSGFVP